MGVTDAESKYRAKQRRRRGLQKTRFYCQVCERQCLDENGFSCHIKSEVHMRNLRRQLADSSSSRQLIDGFSDAFLDGFTALLRRTHGHKLVGLNRFYQEYIRDREHVHLNATRWRSISAVARFLQQSGRARVVELADGEEDGDARVADAERFLIAAPQEGETAPAKRESEPVDEPLTSIGADDNLPTVTPAPGLRHLQAQVAAGEELLQQQQRQQEQQQTPAAPPAAPLAGRTKLAFSLARRKRPDAPRPC